MSASYRALHFQLLRDLALRFDILNEEKKYREPKERITMMNSQRSDIEKVSLIEEGKKISINKVIKRNELINNSLK